MTLTISTTFIFYWIFSIVFEAIVFYIAFQNFKKTDAFSTFKMMKDVFFRVIKPKSTPPIIFYSIIAIALFWIFIFTAPMIFPLVIFRVVRKLFGYKTKLEKQYEAKENEDAEAKKRAEEWQRTEGVQPETSTQESTDDNSFKHDFEEVIKPSDNDTKQ